MARRAIADRKPALPWFALLFLTLVCFSRPASSQAPASSAPATPSEAGIPVTDPLTISKCSGCHTPDGKGNLSRISWIRTTPEGWEEPIKRMVRLHGLSLTPDEARKILRYLADSHGLAPEEAAPVAYLPEQRMVNEKLPSEGIQHACASCHAFARPLSYRRSKEDWGLLKNMHIAFFPQIENTSFLRGSRWHPSKPGPKEEPVDQALKYLSEHAKLHSPEWAAWQAEMSNPRLAGRWLVYGTETGKGKFVGEMLVETVAASGELSTKIKLTFLKDGSVLTSAGSAVVYTGYAWRGRAKVAAASSAPDAPSDMREVMTLSRDQSELHGRWYWGNYHEFGMEVTLRRALDSTTVMGVDVSSLKAGGTGLPVKIYGDHFAPILMLADIDLGPGVKVTKIVSKTPGMLSVLADVAAEAKPGPRTISVKSAVAPAAYAVYDKVDYLRVTPETPLARLGEEVHGKGYCQFEAVAYSNGPDGKPDTSDDIDLGPVTAQWKMEEFVSTYGDDDTQFVGSLNAETGLFTPASDGPNPQRKFWRNNYGNVWVVATAQPDGAAAPLTAKSYLVVTIPTYVRYDQPEVAP